MSHIFTSKRPSVLAKAKEQETSFHDLFLQDCQRYSDEVALICANTGREVTYKQVLATMDRMKCVLYHSFNVRKGKVVALMVPNTPEWVSLFHAIVGLGAIVSPINSMFNGSEVEKQLRLSNATAIIGVSHFETVINEAVKAIGTVTCCLLDKSEELKAPSVAPLPSDYEVTRAPDDVIVLPFSSGTTGLPKGVQLTNRSLVSNLIQTDGAVTFSPETVVLSVLPYFHIYGMVVVLHGVMHKGGRQVVMPKFDMEQYLKLLQQHRATHLFVAPPIMVGFVKHPMTKQIDTSCVKLVLSGAAPLGEEVQRMCEPLFPNATIGQGYGLTETSPVITVVEEGMKVYGSAGLLVADTEMRVVKVDDDGKAVKDLGYNEEGELWVRGPQVMKGYLRVEDNTVVFPEPGWFRTGDLVKVADDGNVYITDRIKELIKYKGYQVAPAELEAVIQTHPFVLECIVVGVMDKEEGAGNEIPRAWVSLKPGLSEDDKAKAEAEIIKFVDEKVAPYKKLRGGVKIVDSIPKTASGKLLRRVVRDAENKATQ